MFTYISGDVRLYPVQEFVLKLFYGQELSAVIPTESDRQIVARKDPFGSKKEVLSEVEYLQYLKENGRVFIPDQAPEWLLGAMGRRSGKSLLGQVIVANELLSQHSETVENCSQKRIANLVITPNQELSKYAQTWFEKCIQLLPLMSSKSSNRLEFSSNITLRFTTAWTAHQGVQSKVTFLDEVAYMPEAKDVLVAIIPIVSNGKLICLSGPGETECKFHQMYQKAERALRIQLPTWEVNPTIPENFYRATLDSLGERDFWAEIGAQFLPKEPKSKESVLKSAKIKLQALLDRKGWIRRIIAGRDFNGYFLKVIVSDCTHIDTEIPMNIQGIQVLIEEEPIE